MKEHDWAKTNLVNLEDHGMIYVNYKCKNCEVTGRRLGLSWPPIPDKKFQKEKYLYCKADEKMSEEEKPPDEFQYEEGLPPIEEQVTQKKTLDEEITEHTQTNQPLASVPQSEAVLGAADTSTETTSPKPPKKKKERKEEPKEVVKPPPAMDMKPMREIFQNLEKAPLATTIKKLRELGFN